MDSCWMIKSIENRCVMNAENKHVGVGGFFPCWFDVSV